MEIKKVKANFLLNKDGRFFTFNYSTPIATSNNQNMIVIGKPYEGTDWCHSIGKVLTYIRKSENIWELSDTLFMEELGEYAEFGTSVALTQDGKKLFVGATGINSDSGKVYIFQRNVYTKRWEKFDEIELPHKISDFDDLFGSSIAISEDASILAIGAEGRHILDDFDDYIYKGEIFIYKKINNKYMLDKILTPITTQEIKNFSLEEYEPIDIEYKFRDFFLNLKKEYFNLGSSLSMTPDGRVLIAGANNRNHRYKAKNSEGSVYTFIKDENQDYKLLSELKLDYEISKELKLKNFGMTATVSKDGLTAIIGATKNFKENFALIYRRKSITDNWKLVRILQQEPVEFSSRLILNKNIVHYKGGPMKAIFKYHHLKY